MNAIIQVGRRIKYRGDMCNPSGEGVIVVVNGTPGQREARHLQDGIGLIVRGDDCYFDAILFDGRKLQRQHEHCMTGIAPRIELMEKVHGEAIIAVAHKLAEQRIADEEAKAEREREEFEKAEASRVIETAPLFYYNGIRDYKGAKLQKCHYSEGKLIGHPEGTITIYAREYGHFSKVVHDCFAVKNDSDIMTDYFDKDRIRVIPAHPLYAKVKEAFDAQQKRTAERIAKRY